MTEDIRYPTGKFIPQPYSQQQKEQWLLDIKFLPSELEQAIQNLNEQQLQTPYRDRGWTVHQLIHHIADSHMNAYIRCKLALTEDNPTIKTYNQDAWAQLNDVQTLPINISLTLLHALHKRWFAMLQNISENDWQRTVYHPEQQKELTLWHLLGMYSWHGKHHLAHITNLREKMNW